ncbi:hypothetical protein D918_02384 [Trichuris suis]|nr:hypothetical protein D918_02384 [Trichuris suis]
MASYRSYLMTMWSFVALLSCLAEQVAYGDVVTTEPKFVDIATNSSSIWLYQKHPKYVASAWKSVFRPLSLALYWCGWSTSLCLWSYIMSSVLSINNWIACYAAFVSLAAVSWIYRWGTPTRRNKQIFPCAMQIVGAMLVYLNCQFRGLSLSVLAGLLVLRCLPFGAFMKCWSKLRRLHLFTAEEYEDQRRFGTIDKLLEFRTICNNALYGCSNAPKRLNNRDRQALI